ncbi:hypothetical protein BACCIP111883_03251 [Sutcliffiella rhizosphaerae]|uniref:N-acetyltransferase domain-containing protein n=2 Tax=Sutcliffiella rhizosphaerae TaxID=2880967 RepID=A0ABN8AB88_9BACI|nr:hypothetical protein BACCIP111883_03251 [Sutcliffiella rhizosphaerae]
MVVAETDRLLLKVFEQEDAMEVKRFWGDEEVMAQCSGATPHSKIPKNLEFYRDCYEKNGISVYAVVEKTSGHVIGAAGFNVESSINQVELIYHFAKDIWGNGYATEAAKACMDIARKLKSVTCIFASADPKNTSSHHILQKLGFQFVEMRWFEDTKQEEPYYEMQF